MPPESKVDSTLIKYIHGAYAEDYVSWVDRLDEHLQSKFMNDWLLTRMQHTRCYYFIKIIISKDMHALYFVLNDFSIQH